MTPPTKSLPTGKRVAVFQPSLNVVGRWMRRQIGLETRKGNGAEEAVGRERKSRKKRYMVSGTQCWRIHVYGEMIVKGAVADDL